MGALYLAPAARPKHREDAIVAKLSTNHWRTCWVRLSS
jgi:hypothetical protein